MPDGVVFNPPPITVPKVSLWDNAAFPEGTPSEEKTLPIIIYYFIFFTTLKNQFTFATQLYDLSSAATFKSVALICGLYAFIYQ